MALRRCCAKPSLVGCLPFRLAHALLKHSDNLPIARILFAGKTTHVHVIGIDGFAVFLSFEKGRRKVFNDLQIIASAKLFLRPARYLLETFSPILN